MKIDFARLNQLLIPETKSARDRYRNGRVARRLRGFTWVFTRLSTEGRSLLTIICVGALFGVEVGRTEAHVLVLAAASLLFATLSFTAFYPLSGVRAEARAPRRVTLGDELRITISLSNGGERAYRTLRVEPPLLPWDGVWGQPPAAIAELAAGGRASTVFHARFRARGAHHIDCFRAALLLPLGLSQGAPLWTQGLHFSVVPKVARVVSVSTPMNRRHQPGGVAHASRTGDATDLLGVRPYRPGDPVRDLHARSWARHGVPVVREYQEEYFSRIGLVLDTDADTGTPAELEALLSLAAGIVAHLCRGEAIVDVLVAGEFVHRLSLGRSLGSLDQALDVLAAVKHSKGFATERILANLGPHFERLSSVVIVALGWDDQRAHLARAIRSRGLGCLALVVGDRAFHVPDATTVPLDAIVNGEPLSL